MNKLISFYADFNVLNMRILQIKREGKKRILYFHRKAVTAMGA